MIDQFKLTVDESSFKQSPNSITFTAENQAGDDMWWTAKTLHGNSWSLQIVIGSFQKPEFDTLNELLGETAGIN